MTPKSILVETGTPYCYRGVRATTLLKLCPNIVDRRGESKAVWTLSVDIDRRRGVGYICGQTLMCDRSEGRGSVDGSVDNVDIDRCPLDYV
ncbi:hypothetical protein M8J77_000994 [Diaphorina citri]|nr:hypothetical protein M8J77_000994 [Diaphorina citri]